MTSRSAPAAVVVLLSALAAGTAWAGHDSAALQDLEALLDTEVEGASRLLESALDAPAVVSTIHRAETAALGHRTVGEMLERLPGIYLGTTRDYGRVGLRGLSRPGDYNARLLMSIDGYRVNDALFDQALPGWEFPIVADWVKRLELVSGPASSVYGSNALLGVVNAVTLDGADAPGVRLRVGAGSFGTRDAVLNYGWNEGDADLFAGLALHASDGETLQDPALAGPAAPDGRVAGLDGTRYRSLFLKWRRGDWRLTLVSQERVKDSAIAAYGTLPGVAGNRYVDRYDYAEVAWDGAWRGDWRASTRLNLSASRFQGDYVYGEPRAPWLNRDELDGRWLGADVRLQWRGWLNHQLTLGVEGRHVFDAVQRNFDVGGGAPILWRRDTQTQAALYAQDQWRLAEQWALTGGARVDRVQDHGAALSPRLALVWRPSAPQAVKLLYGQGFRVPNLAERFYDDGGMAQRANPGLRAEHIRTVALAWERSVGTHGRLAVSLYRDRLRDLIELVGERVGQYRNMSRLRTRGLDVEGEWRPAAGWQLRGSVTLQQVRDGQGRQGDAPRWIAKGHVLAPLAPSWSAGLQAQALGRRSPLLPAQGTVDAVLQWQPAPGRSLGLRALNLTDERIWDPATPVEVQLARIPQERRRLELSWQQAF
ncbi:TonB-dependent receptor plug domain-containing protein [Azohydromonas caseinilytica]|uniref:TonB-dependent receptor n=1 Tax=Azohydromonas caseinilytica TaxID=2728836 RepID=A0A848F264_9BURK|nr:TonB-dependent receptor [Azohydromonas caseinilytica]NML13774.1 TonB-dependent receptor [Azohydromonas caseinilytica]